jgi:hypothetical protein
MSALAARSAHAAARTAGAAPPRPAPLAAAPQEAPRRRGARPRALAADAAPVAEPAAHDGALAAVTAALESLGGADAHAAAAANSNAAVADWLCATYRVTHRSRVRAKVARAAAALAAADPTLGPLSLARDVLPKLELLEALAPGLGWAVFSRYPEEFAHPDAVDYWRIMAAYLYTAGFEPEAVSALFRKHVSLFARTVQAPDNLVRLFGWLRAAGFDGPGVLRLVGRHPLVLQADARALEARLAWVEGLGLDRPAAAAALRRLPELLAVDSAALAARADFFRSEAGLADAEVAALFRAQPAVFALSVEATLRPAVAALREGLGAEGPALAALAARSGLLSRAPTTVAARAAAWRVAAGWDAAALRAALRRFPRLLLFDVEAPQHARKLEFLREELQLAPGPALAAFPQFVSYSLPRRVAPRVAAARRFAGAPPPLRLLALTDERFAAALGVSQDAYAAWLRDEWTASEAAARWGGEGGE